MCEGGISKSLFWSGTGSQSFVAERVLESVSRDLPSQTSRLGPRPQLTVSPLRVSTFPSAKWGCQTSFSSLWFENIKLSSPCILEPGRTESQDHLPPQSLPSPHHPEKMATSSFFHSGHWALSDTSCAQSRGTGLEIGPLVLSITANLTKRASDVSWLRILHIGWNQPDLARFPLLGEF